MKFSSPTAQHKDTVYTLLSFASISCPRWFERISFDLRDIPFHVTKIQCCASWWFGIQVYVFLTPTCICCSTWIFFIFMKKMNNVAENVLIFLVGQAAVIAIILTGTSALGLIFFLISNYCLSCRLLIWRAEKDSFLVPLFGLWFPPKTPEDFCVEKL